MGQISGHPFCRDHASLGEDVKNTMKCHCFKLFNPARRGEGCRVQADNSVPSLQVIDWELLKTPKRGQKWFQTFPKNPKLWEWSRKKNAITVFCWYSRYSHFSRAPWPTYLLPSKALTVDLWTWCEWAQQISPTKLTQRLCSSHHHKCILWSYPCECFNESCKTGTNTCMHEVLQPDIATAMNGICEDVPSRQLASAVKSDDSQLWMLFRTCLCNVSAHKGIEIMFLFQDFCRTALPLGHIHPLSPHWAPSCLEIQSLRNIGSSPLASPKVI